jgi:predicted patatin/cPLA2 family phospholipase
MDEEYQESVEDKQVILTNIDISNIRKVLIPNGLTLYCKFIFQINSTARSDFEVLKACLPGLIDFDRNFLKASAFEDIKSPQINQTLRAEINNTNGSLLMVKFLPCLSHACDIDFHPCRIIDHNGNRMFEPTVVKHDISKTIYYMSDASNEFIRVILITYYTYIHQIYNKISSVKDKNVHNKVQLYQKLIENYIVPTRNIQFHQHLLLISKWQQVYMCYESMQLLNYEILSKEALDYSRCLIMLSKYSLAEKKLNKLIRDTKGEDCEMRYLLAKAQRKRENYSNTEENIRNYEKYLLAAENIERAFFLDPTRNDIEKERTIIRRVRERQSLTYDIKRTRRADNCLSYNILSIDGGGIRGIIAAIWLRELERRTERSCSSMFQMMAGTSTGAIIAAGLSVPNEDDPRMPRHDISDIIGLYKDCGKQIFVQKKSSSPVHLLAHKYASSFKKNLFEEKFGETLLCQCLTDILIPAVKSGDTYTHLFTRNDNLYSTRLVDVLMATTAAPTYFKAHSLNGIKYVDGGVQMNNPTLAAYTKAIEYGHNRENIFVLSLGTGDYTGDLFADEYNRNLFHYVRHPEGLLKILLDSQQHNVDYQMSHLMDDKHYYRWQVWFEEEIELDKYEPYIINKLENIAYEYWEEMEMYDDNRLYELIRRFKKEQIII